MKPRTLMIVGGLAWLILGVAVYAGTTYQDAKRKENSVSLLRYFAGPSEIVERRDPSGRLRVDDPVFLQDRDGTWLQVGHVSEVGQSSPDQIVRIAWYADDLAAANCRFVFHRNTGGLDQVVATMLPAEKREQLKGRLENAMAVHGAELSAAFLPLVQESIQRSLPIIEEEFRHATERHREELDRLAARWNEEVVAERLIPLARREVMPIVRRHGQPIAEQIGRELWDRASLWRFGWRAVYDRAPLPERNLLQGEWDRFVERDAIPVFEDHVDDIVVVVQKVMSDIAANSAVRSEFAEVADQVASDPETQELTRQILRETLVDNPRLREAWREVWNGEEAQAAMRLASVRLEPVIRGIGDDLFGTRETGINPHFARVLRNQILLKDRRWIVAHDGRATGSLDEESATIETADTFIPYPVVYLADRPSTRQDSGDAGG